MSALLPYAVIGGNTPGAMCALHDVIVIALLRAGHLCFSVWMFTEPEIFMTRQGTLSEVSLRVAGVTIIYTLIHVSARLAQVHAYAICILTDLYSDCYDVWALH